MSAAVKMHSIKSDSGQKSEGKHGAVLKIPEQCSVVSIMDLGRLLLDAAKEGNTKRVYELMLKGAPFTTDWLGTTPLHFAAKNNHLDTCQVLLRGGLSKDARTKVDRTPLHLAVFEEHIDIVALLLSHKCNPNAKDMLKMTPLHWAVEKENVKLVEILLKSGADASIESKFGKTPILMAVEKSNKKIVQMLMDPVYSQELIKQTEIATKSIKSEMERPEVVIDDSDIVIDEEGNIVSPRHSPTYDTDHLIEEDDGISVSEMINQMDAPASPGLDSIGLKVLREHGIQMLPQDDTNIIQNALESGCKLVLSEAGKLVLKNASKLSNNLPPFTSPSTSITPIMSRKRHNIVSPISLPQKKIIKLTPNKDFHTSPSKKASSDLSSSKRKQNFNKFYTKTLDKLPQGTTLTIAATDNDDSENEPNERIADVQELDDYDEDFLDGADAHDNRISKLEQQMQQMKRETDMLRRELEKSHKQNELYRLRIEKLESAVLGNRSKEKS